jgi:DNA mismatch endonuclease, patch repair protein
MTAKRRRRRALTRSEKALRSALWELGLRYRVDLRVEGVHVDVAFPPAKAAVFVDGCFWHSCPEHGTKPRSNKSYWLPKLCRNRARDRAQSKALQRARWKVWARIPYGERLPRVVAPTGFEPVSPP